MPPPLASRGAAPETTMEARTRPFPAAATLSALGPPAECPMTEKCSISRRSARAKTSSAHPTKVVFSFQGQGRVFDTDGQLIESVSAPPEALPSLDGAAFDFREDVGLLINQSCRLIEVDPSTFEVLATHELAAAHSVSTCAGLAVSTEGTLVFASYGTNEVGEVSRDPMTEIRRIDTAAIGLPGPDGIAEIAGSYNYLVNTTIEPYSAVIIDGLGNPLVGPSPIGMAPISGGGQVGQPDCMLTVCSNGNMWLCDAYQTTCSIFAPSRGDFQACGCLAPG